MDKDAWQKRGTGHRERLRERFLAYGIESFTDAEVLELLLTMGTPRKDCKVAARAALDHFESLARVLEASIEDLGRIEGLGQKNIIALKFIHAVARRFLAERIKQKNYLRSSRDVISYLRHFMADMKREVFLAIYLDAEHGILDTQILSEGSLTTNTVYPRELIKAALDRYAAAIVVAHNHPSGNLTPSPEDRRLTRHLFIACAMMDIRLLDHLIVGAGPDPFSFADQGIMTEIRAECEKIIMAR